MLRKDKIINIDYRDDYPFSGFKVTKDREERYFFGLLKKKVKGGIFYRGYRQEMPEDCIIKGDRIYFKPFADFRITDGSRMQIFVKDKSHYDRITSHIETTDYDWIDFDYLRQL